MKLHLALDEEEILSMCLSENSFKDNQVFNDLVKGLKGEVSHVSAHETYDDSKIYDKCEKLGINPLIPPKKNSKLKHHDNSKAKPIKRDEVLRNIKKLGRKRWKLKSSYSKKSISQTAMYCF